MNNEITKSTPPPVPAKMPVRRTELKLPAVDITENGSGVQMYLEMPGVAAPDVSVEVNGNILTVKGQSCLKCGGNQVAFQREFQLSDGADLKGICAKTTDGVLMIKIPKSDQAKVHKVKVE